ncbi:uncharacterized protein LOC144173610 [Haemaphysalis longicornis]
MLTKAILVAFAAAVVVHSQPRGSGLSYSGGGGSFPWINSGGAWPIKPMPYAPTYHPWPQFQQMPYQQTFYPPYQIDIFPATKVQQMPYQIDIFPTTKQTQFEPYIKTWSNGGGLQG